MRAYVFWHYPAAGVESGAYERSLAAFHEALKAAPPAGFVGSASYRTAALPWLPPGPGYEDWYEVEGSAALDPLDAAAVSSGLLASHDAAARLAGGGTAGLYRLLRRAERDPGEESLSIWLAKPSGMPSAGLHDKLAAILSPDWAVWQRQMALGPAPEYCLIGPRAEGAPPGLPAAWARVEVPRRRIFGGGSRPGAPPALETLEALLATAPARLRAIPGEAAALKPAPGRWSRKEELGHLIDSAFNNHQRVVRTQLEAGPSMPGYDGDRWVALHGYQGLEWERLIDLWVTSNRQLLRAARGAAGTDWARTCTVKGSRPLSLAFLLEDYLKHLVHHLRHIGVEDDLPHS